MSLVAILAADERAANDAIQMRLDQRRADEAANAAVQRAMCVLTSANTSIVTLNDDWALQGTSGDDEFTFDSTNATYRMQIIDAGSLINMNAAAGASSVTPAIPGITAVSSPMLQLMPLQQDQMDSLLDWVGNPNTQALSDGGKDSYYNGLPTPYDSPMGLSPNGTTTAGLTTVNELLLVNNWTAQTLYQPASSTGQSSQTSSDLSTSTSTASLPTDTNGQVLPLASLMTVDSGSPNTQASGSARVSLSSALGSIRPRLSPPTLTSASRSTSFQQLFTNVPQLRTSANETTLLNTVTFLSTTTGTSAASQRIVGRVNLNTASQAVLQMVPGMPSSAISTIVSQQSTGFQTLGALATSAGLTAAQVANLADYFTIGSDTWIVRAYGQSGKVGTALEVVVRVSTSSTEGETAQVINWERLNTTGIPTWWDWHVQSVSTIDAGASE
jgi:DNA uptake protein ComE-like DNA-binding protein